MITDVKSIYPYVGAIIALVSFYLFSGVWMRVISLVSTSLWLYYSILVGSYGGMAQQTFILASLVFTITRLVRHKKVLASAETSVQ